MNPLHTLLNPTPAAWDQFGTSVAVSGNLVVVGAPWDDAGAADSGAAYIYDATTGALLHTLLNPTPAASDQFGSSVAVSGNTVVVGALRDGTAAANSGAAYIYDATTGALLHTLLNPTPAEWDSFGNSVAVSGNTVVVGAPDDDAGATDSGAAYIYDATTGALLRTLLNPTPAAWDSFGNSVAVSGDLVVVGSFRDSGDRGAAYIYDATTGALLHTLLNPTPAVWDQFGTSVAVSGNLIVVGAPLDDTVAEDSGAAYIYNATTGALLHTLLNPTLVEWESFGNSVAVSGNTVAVGARNYNGDVGVAYIYDATTGALLHTVLNPTPAAGDLFGNSVAVSGSTVVVGAPSDATGAAASGAAYIYHTPVGQTQTATGFLNTTSFGAPLSHATYLALAASGATTTTFGSPWGGFVAGPRTFDAVGLNNEAVFGGVAAIATATAQTEGWSTSALGTPRARQTFPVSGWMTTTLGSPRVGSRHFASGWENWAGFGPPSAHPSAIITQNWTTQAQGSSATVFGTAAALSAVAQRASGWATGSLGAPTSRQAFAASGWSSTVVSAATSHSTASQRAAGWVSGGIGAPSARQTLTAAAWATGGLGTPTSHQLFVADGWQAAVIGSATAVFRTQASGFSSTSWGRGRVARRLFATATSPRTRFGSRQTSQRTISGGQPQTATTYQAEGFSETHIGAHNGYASLSARHKPPSVRFGRATVRRGTIC